MEFGRTSEMNLLNLIASQAEGINGLLQIVVNLFCLQVNPFLCRILVQRWIFSYVIKHRVANTVS